MAKIYLVRHGESIANTKGIYQGQTYNTGLSQLGQNQAQRLAIRFKDIQINQIIASPLARTLVTAKVVGEVKNIGVLTDPLIIETNHGEWEGQHKHIIEETWPKIYQTWINTPGGTIFPNGEKFTDTQQRVLNWWKNIIHTKKDTLVVTHDNIIRIVLADTLKQDINTIWGFTLNPTGITEIEITNGFPTVKYINNIEHLAGLVDNIALHAL